MKQAALIAACGLALVLGGCFDEEEKVLDIVLTGETSADFDQNETTSSWTEAAVIDVASQIRDVLEENGYTQDDLKSAHLTSVSYGVTAFFYQPHDWSISGSIRVSADGGASQPVLSYASQSVQAALDKKISPSLQTAGVDVVNGALDDFVQGANPVLGFVIQNLGTTPTPSVDDPMVFTWRAWLAIQVVIDQEVKVFDPF
ncbi:MAG TPA: hypothetical protein VF247_05700 [Candidatus Krumholzibacteria bacterium]